MGKCKLCKESKELLKKSHIIPDFMYKGLYDEDHKITYATRETFKSNSNKIKRCSSGEYESQILCADCDNKVIGDSLEDYASKIIYGKNLSPRIAPISKEYEASDGTIFTNITNINYTKFKLFLLSILWRASISSRPFFSDIKLGPHEEVIRNMILKGNPGSYTDYPILILSFIKKESVPEDIITKPRKLKTSDGHNTYIFAIGGLVYIFYINAKYHKLPDVVLEYSLKENNNLKIIHLTNRLALKLIIGLTK